VTLSSIPEREFVSILSDPNGKTLGIPQIQSRRVVGQTPGFMQDERILVTVELNLEKMEHIEAVLLGDVKSSKNYSSESEH